MEPPLRDLGARWMLSVAPEQKVPTLRDITLNIKLGQLVGIIGVVGSRKSSLITSLLGETLQVPSRDLTSPSVS